MVQYCSRHCRYTFFVFTLHLFLCARAYMYFVHIYVYIFAYNFFHALISFRYMHVSASWSTTMHEIFWMTSYHPVADQELYLDLIVHLRWKFTSSMALLNILESIKKYSSCHIHIYLAQKKRLRFDICILYGFYDVYFFRRGDQNWENLVLIT